MTEEQYAELQRRGQGARSLLESEAWKLAYAEVAKDIQATWTTAETRDERERLFAEFKGLERMAARLKAVADDAKYEFDKREKRVRRRAD